MKKIRWGYKGKLYVSDVLAQSCPKCGKKAIVELPEDILAAQPDDTTHVCHPSAGGCNHGYAHEIVTHVPGGQA